MTAPLSNARQLVWVSRVLGDDHYKRIPRVTVGVARLRTLTGQRRWMPNIGQNLQPLPAVVTSPYEWKILEWDDKPETNRNKQTNKQTSTIIIQCIRYRTKIKSWFRCFNLELWSNKWLLKFNSSKRKVVFFSKKEVSVMPKLFFNGERLEFAPVHCHLCIFFQKALVELISLICCKQCF